jgi:hypothetical protein
MAIIKPNFQSILDIMDDDVERPKPVPVGTYLCTVISKREDKSSKKQTDFIEYTLKPIAAGEDVNEEDLEECGGLENKTLRLTFYLVEPSQGSAGSLWRLKEFLNDCGVPKGGSLVGDRAPAAINTQVYAYVTHTVSQDGQAVFANVTKTAQVK